jgi:anti-sigma regulatory factor (Ser/Thr protein kinase)
MMKRSEMVQYNYSFSSLHEFAAIREKIQSHLTILSPQAAQLFFMSINEAVNNSLFHGNQEDTNKKVTLTILTLAEEIQVVICDEGKGFAYSEVSCNDPLCEEGGRGLAFIKYGADSYQYNAKGNELTLIKGLAIK